MVASGALSLPAYLLVGASAFQTTTIPCVMLQPRANLQPQRWRIAAVRHSGWLASAAATALTCRLAAKTTTSPLAAAAWFGAIAASVAALLGAIASDVLGLHPQLPHAAAALGDTDNPAAGAAATAAGSRRGGWDGAVHSVAPGACDSRVAARLCFFCGNIGLLVAAAAGSAVDMMSVLRSQVRLRRMILQRSIPETHP
jgi:hypothetical protein